MGGDERRLSVEDRAVPGVLIHQTGTGLKRHTFRTRVRRCTEHGLCSAELGITLEPKEEPYAQGDDLASMMLAESNAAEVTRILRIHHW